ncbi:hypothetical protein PZ897_08800 [Hoeflea sp. YIM 152468]|uniref:hypothetical protein n=1 Tax=Hoeflea sp. YIM 152468 TaxID=3031759 RepID=UPI0023DABDED|nr:hypothetical protein [Hoeflea sp. YIM 152468]MDF1608271.1 hypothetical protein [Hoeflea sp. YIM 152468]
MNMHLNPTAISTARTYGSDKPSDEALTNWPLRSIVNDTKTRPFCGPTAVAAITRQPISIVKDAFRLARFGKRWIEFDRSPAIMGVTLAETYHVMNTFGFGGGWESFDRAPSLAAWLETRTGIARTHPVIVHVTGHLVAVRGYEFCDTFSKGLVVDADEAPGRRKKVKDVFVVTGRTPRAAHIPSKSGRMVEP